ncbi:coproporphyrinogen dehydrogenase HemZ [Faecalicatena contorta]|uniref:coproporphyrinogen dehydrogenase HemZ n=1 Tax=Faecalicatena contorta TaxID=39482 RepID=UPI001F3C17B2|nr:coproporphyrinogen dehydrogenase HemZ [Faecalicatena contorta]MCF2681564.1 coproporphyrinogen dehydrogenase HemZ [Faecalicatena contorta]
MIQIICKSEAYTYNTYHMMKAFYPSEEISCQTEEKASNYVTVKLPEEQEEEVLQIKEEQICATADEREKKYQIDIQLYDLLKEKTGRELAWGILTGVRPTKIAMQELETGRKEEDFIPWFTEEFRVRQDKAHLAWEIANREKQLLDRLDYEEGYSLYVGIPFCPTVCTYCSFSSGSLEAWKHRVEDYLEALCRELRFIAERSREKKLNTIYIGGGTPTTLDAEQLERLLSCIDTNFSREYLLEYTVEAGRPDSITEEKLQVIKRHQVTRISINPQSMQQKTLDVIGRRHTVEQIKEAYALAREVGFDNINMDIIAGLPGEEIRDMEDTLEQITLLSPDSLTVHSLAIKRAAKMEMKDLNRDTGKMNETLSGMIEAAQKAAKKMELYPYYLYRQKNIAGNFENVGYAKVDKAGIYNILIMEEKQSIIAAGAGASTKLVLKNPVPVPGSKKKKTTRLIRVENVKAIDAYIVRIDEMIERKGEWLWH